MREACRIKGETLVKRKISAGASMHATGCACHRQARAGCMATATATAMAMALQSRHVKRCRQRRRNGNEGKSGNHWHRYPYELEKVSILAHSRPSFSSTSLVSVSYSSSENHDTRQEEKRKRRSPLGTHIRRAKLADVEAVAALCGEAFHPNPSRSIQRNDSKKAISKDVPSTKFKLDEPLMNTMKNISFRPQSVMNYAIEASDGNPIIMGIATLFTLFQKQRLEQAVRYRREKETERVQ